MESILLDRSEIVGQIYLMRNTVSRKPYVGQTVSHRLNKGKYRPFGYIGRFNDHVSEAVCNTKKKQCRYLNNAIRRDGKEAFTVDLIHTCPVADLDTWEQHYIKEHNSLYPNGYNLTVGGKTGYVAHEEETAVLAAPRKRGGCTMRTTETRAKMSARIKEHLESPEERAALAKRTQAQHLKSKIAKFAGLEIDKTTLDDYIHVRNSSKMGQYIEIIVGKMATTFVGKHDTIEQLYERAKEFLRGL